MADTSTTWNYYRFDIQRNIPKLVVSEYERAQKL